MRGRSLRSVAGTAAVLACLGTALLAAPGADSGESLALGSDSPSWSPDGQMLAFTGFRAGRPGDVYVIRQNGRGERRLTKTAAHEDMPRWSNDGRRLAFVRTIARVTQVFVMNADGTGERQLTSAKESSFAPSWSPDDTQIAFARGRDSVVGSDSINSDDRREPGVNHVERAAEIYVVRADGGSETRLTDDNWIDTHPAWSPDGTMIAFTSDRLGAGAQHIYLMQSDGTGLRKLTDHPATFQNELRPTWSRDGSTIAFVSEREPPLGNSEIYTVGVDGRETTRVTSNVFHDDWPTWGPDGELAIARGITSFRPEIWVVNADRSLARKVTGKNLYFVAITRSPKEPRAARRYVVELAVRPAVDTFTDVACAATLADQLVPEIQPRVVQGRLRCVWMVPRTAKGKLFRAILTAGAGGSEVTRMIARHVR